MDYPTRRRLIEELESHRQEPALREWALILKLEEMTDDRDLQARQLAKVDEVLAWDGTGRGRIETILDLQTALSYQSIMAERGEAVVPRDGS